MAPTTRARAAGPDLVPAGLHTLHYGQRASAGLIIAEGTWVSARAIGFPDVPGIYTERQAAAWRRVTGAVHGLGGRIVLQLSHTGACSHPDHLGGERPAGPSAINPRELSRTPSGPQPTVVPKEMTAAGITATVADYAAAAGRARRAGFDGVEIAANGTHLIAQLLTLAKIPTAGNVGALITKLSGLEFDAHLVVAVDQNGRACNDIAGICTDDAS